MTTDFVELDRVLNEGLPHRGYWAGEIAVIADVDPAKVETSVLAYEDSRMFERMLGLGYRLVKTYMLDLGDDDCPKETTFAVWSH